MKTSDGKGTVVQQNSPTVCQPNGFHGIPGDLRRCDAATHGELANFTTHAPLIRPVSTETTFGSGKTIRPCSTGRSMRP